MLFLCVSYIYLCCFHHLDFCMVSFIFTWGLVCSHLRLVDFSSETGFGLIISTLGILWCWWLPRLFSNMHSDMVLLNIHSHVAWLQAEQTVSSLHHWYLPCSIKDFCFQLSPLLMALAGERGHEYSLVWCILSLFCSCPVCSRTVQFPNLLHFPTSEVMVLYLCDSTASCQQKLVQGR